MVVIYYNTMIKSKWTSIKIKEDTRNILKAMGKKGESYEQVIEKLIRVYSCGVLE